MVYPRCYSYACSSQVCCICCIVLLLSYLCFLTALPYSERSGYALRHKSFRVLVFVFALYLLFCLSRRKGRMAHGRHPAPCFSRIMLASWVGILSFDCSWFSTIQKHWWRRKLHILKGCSNICNRILSIWTIIIWLVSIFGNIVASFRNLVTIFRKWEYGRRRVSAGRMGWVGEYSSWGSKFPPSEGFVGPLASSSVLFIFDVLFCFFCTCG